MSEQDDVKRIGAMPAFPLPISAYNKPNAGMTIRQYAAIAALSGMLPAVTGNSNDGSTIVRAAVELADALLRELAK